VEKAVEIGVIDAMVAPDRTRTAVAAAIAGSGLVTRGSHGNIPL
jgi:acetyl-CoA/propionyl-CoA carboxylase carboxyl transferase subunit